MNGRAFSWLAPCWQKIAFPGHRPKPFGHCHSGYCRFRQEPNPHMRNTVGPPSPTCHNQPHTSHRTLSPFAPKSTTVRSAVPIATTQQRSHAFTYPGATQGQRQSALPVLDRRYCDIPRRPTPLRMPGPLALPLSGFPAPRFQSKTGTACALLCCLTGRRLPPLRLPACYVSV